MQLHKLLKSVSWVPWQQTIRLFGTSLSLKPEQVLPLMMLSEDELALKHLVARLAKEQVAPYVREMEADRAIKQSILDACFKNGLMGIEIPVEYGGAGCRFMSTVQTIEEMSKVDGGIGGLIDIQNTLVNSILIKLGNKEQKEKYLPRLAKNMVGSFCLSEASSGSDAFAMKTTAKQDGSDFLINGTKMWISSSKIAGVFIVMANARPEAGYKGITVFLVDRETPGVSVGKPEKTIGLRCSSNCPVIFDNVRVPKTSVLGEIGLGYKYAANFLNEGRVGVASHLLGIAQGCFDATIPYTLERKQFERKIFDFQGMQHQIALIATQIEAARLLIYHAARLVEQKMPFVKEAAMAKYFAAEVAQQTTIKCIDWMGGVGITEDFIQEKCYRDCKAGSIYEGTYNIQLNTIAKCIERDYK